MSKILIVIGNGPSVKDIDFDLLKKYDTFGLNAAYRMFKRINFWPTYYGCFDYVVCNHHKKEFAELVKNSPIKKFYFLEKKYFAKDIQNNHKFQIINFINDKTMTKPIPKTFLNYHNAGCSGANAVQIGIMLGYTKILLVGCDCNYINIIEGSKKVGKIMKIIKTPTKNPNYWFDDYQRKGDIFNVPNAHIFHMPAWKRLYELTKDSTIEIINCSCISKIPYFIKKDIDIILQDKIT